MIEKFWSSISRHDRFSTLILDELLVEKIWQIFGKSLHILKQIMKSIGVCTFRNDLLWIPKSYIKCILTLFCLILQFSFSKNSRSTTIFLDLEMIDARKFLAEHFSIWSCSTFQKSRILVLDRGSTFLMLDTSLILHISPPPWYSQYFSTFCYSWEFPGNRRNFPGIPDSREWKFCSRKFIQCSAKVQTRCTTYVCSSTFFNPLNE